MDEQDNAPFDEFYDLGTLGRGGAEVDVSATGDALSRIAQWAGVAAVESFAAKVKLRKHSANRFALDADLKAEIVQDCVVTLEPVRTHIERTVHRELHLADRMRFRAHESVSLGAGAGDDEVPEEIENLHYDLAGPLLEEFALAIDPYPRAPGVEFDAPSEPEAPADSPFAVLKTLKNRP